jgi:uncharacterized protein (TIGR01244 family)
MADHFQRMGFIILLCAFSLNAYASPPGSPVSEYELKVSDRVVLAGLLNDQALAQLQNEKALVIDLRTPEEGIAVESAAMHNAGVEYHNLPIGKGGLSLETRNSFAKLMHEHPDQPVLVHCRSGNRAGLLWATYLLDGGATPDEALAAVDGIVTSEDVIKAIKAHVPE